MIYALSSLQWSSHGITPIQRRVPSVRTLRTVLAEMTLYLKTKLTRLKSY